MQNCGNGFFGVTGFYFEHSRENAMAVHFEATGQMCKGCDRPVKVKVVTSRDFDGNTRENLRELTCETSGCAGVRV